jgi:hypothetical protein
MPIPPEIVAELPAPPPLTADDQRVFDAAAPAIEPMIAVRVTCPAMSRRPMS